MLKKISLLIFIILSVIYFYIRNRKNDEPNQKEKILTKVLTGKLKSFDPIKCNERTGVQETTKIFDCLFEYEYLERPAKLKPNLIERMPDISVDGKTYTFRLNKNIYFHDNSCFLNGIGRELEAKDIIYSFLRIADSKLKGIAYHYLSDRVIGLDNWRKKYTNTKTNFDESIEGFQVIDKYTFKIKLKGPYPEFLYILSLPFFSIVAREACEKYGEEIGAHPVGTGPFMIQDYYNFQSNKIEYIRNPKFRDKFFPTHGSKQFKEMISRYGGKKIPFIDRIITYIIPEIPPRWLKMKNLEVDFMDITDDGNLNEILNENNELISKLKKLGFKLNSGPSGRTEFLLFNNTDPLFKNNKKLKEAITIACDREGYNKLFKNNLDPIAQSMIAEGLVGYNNKFKNPLYLSNADNNVKKGKLIEKAKQLLIESGFPGGKGVPEIELETLSTTLDRQKGEFFKRNLEEIGIKIKVVTNTLPELVKKGNSKNFVMLKLGWTSGVPEGYELLRFFYGPDSNQGANYSNFHNEKFDRILEEVMVTSDLDKRKLLLENLNKKLAFMVPCVFLTHPTNFILMKNRVKNLEFTPFAFGMEQYVDIVEN